jgi:hypothetical protein
MVLIAITMQNFDNDNELFSFITLAAATANVVRYLESGEQKKPHREREAQRTDNDEHKKEDQRAYIEQRLREISAFEERLRPDYRSRRKRN